MRTSKSIQFSDWIFWIISLPPTNFSTGCTSLVFLLRLADCEHADGLARAVRQDDSTADLLVCMTAVNAQLYVDFNGFVELCCTSLDTEVKRFLRIIKAAAVDELCAIDILFYRVSFMFLLKW